MYTLGTHFEELFKNLRPPQDRLDAARDLPPLVRDYLKEHKEFATVAPHSRLVGSYGQDAAVDDVKDVDFLVTNQPNRIFLRNWRESVQLREEQHIQTLAEHGNLFGAAIPICLERGIDDGRIHPASNLLLGGFSHAGDYSAAAIVRWNG